ncbi:MAG: ATP12 family protein [Pseudomonadota bacterium]
MSAWKSKRFWESTSVIERDGGYSVLLDKREVKTPAKAALVVPSFAMANAISKEWDDQEEEIKPQMMPVTRAANAAIDKVSIQHSEVADIVSAYADADLLCYRADGPSSLAQRQSEAWDPLLDWAAERFHARLTPVVGVMHTAQDSQALSILTKRAHQMDAFALTAFHDLVSLSGSFIIGLAAIENHLSPESLWQISRVDETWQQEQWGEDEDALETARYKESEFLQAKQFYDYLKTDRTVEAE